MAKCRSHHLLILFVCTCIEGQQKMDTLPLKFTQPLYNATIYENAVARTFVECPTKMGIFMMDPSWDVRYRIESGDHEKLFKAERYVLGDFSFLRIRTKGGRSAVLNREVKDHYLLTVQAFERNSGTEAQTQVQLQVLDTNDMRPLFSPTSYTISIPENTPIRTSLGRMMASDADTGTNGEYYFSFKEWSSMFSIHPSNGVITLTGKLDYLQIPRYEIDAIVVDRGLKLYGSNGVGSTAKLTVQVLPANNHVPVITAVPLTLCTASKDDTFAFVTIEDDDEGQNGEIASLSIVAGDPFQQFKVIRMGPGRKEYKIKAIKEVEWEGYNFGYNLTLQAKDLGNPPYISLPVVVRLKSTHEDINCCKAVQFEKALYIVTLSEFAPPHSPAVMVRAMPKHQNIKYLLQFKMQHHRNPFSINPNTGLITTVEPVQADRVSQYEFDVMTSDRQATTKVVIKIIDMNNNAPKFQQSVYEVSVDEHVPVGTTILAVSATDDDDGENGYVTYSIANVNKQPFVIDYFTGVISTSEDLDYEIMPGKFHLKVRASDWGSPFRRETEVMVLIILNNLNDNQPFFESLACEVSMPKTFCVSEQIIVVSAIDADGLGDVQYHIIAGNDMGLFDLDPNFGVLTLKKSLTDGDIEIHPFHTLQISASDGEISSFPMQLNITVDLNINSGLKDIYSKCMETGVPRILHFGSKLYSEMESIDELIDMYSANNHAPQFTESAPSLIEVKEDLPVGTGVVLLKATDADNGFNGKLLFVISGGNFESCFVIESDTGLLKIHVPLDRETTDHYTLIITVYDLGLPQKSSSHILEISVLDVNDNSPEFLEQEYSVDIREDSAVGTDIIQLEATDKDLGINGRVSYCFLTKTDKFAINEETGIVTVQSPLDRETNPSFALKVAAYDKATNEPQMISTVILNIMVEDVNDNAPMFSPPHYYARVMEDIPVGSLILWLQAYDPDLGQSGQVTYSLIDDADGSFQVDKASGAVYLTQALDFERKQLYTLTAKAEDRGKPISLFSACSIEVAVVDVSENLHRPSFPFFVVWGRMSEDAPVGSSVLKVTAHDEDEGRDGEIRFSIHSGSGLGVFSIDETSGVIRTQELLDHETTSHYWLTVYATDQGVIPLSSSVEVYVDIQDVNDNAPQTSEPVYYSFVLENSPKDVSIIQIQAYDPDSSASDQLTYKITSGNPQGFFTIDAQTGLLTTTSRKLDREMQDEHVLEVTISDNGHPTMSTVVHVVVKVQDENDNAPEFLEKAYKIKLVERSKAIEQEPIYRVIAHDKDEHPYSELSYSIEEGDQHRKFFIEPKSGLVSSKEAFSMGDCHVLTIKVQDNGQPQRSSICLLHIEWIAKPEPPNKALAFEETSLQFSARESDPVGHMVGVVSTRHLDSPVWFNIKGGNDDSRYNVEKGSGAVIVAKVVDAEQQSNYSLTVEATDGTRSISTQIQIQVIDTNEYRPTFDQDKYEISIPEEIQPGSMILKISATDKDKESKLSYTLLSSTDPYSLKKFNLDPETGFLYTAEGLDRENMHTHTLTAMVRDQNTPVKFNMVRVIIRVEDSNDNPPWFTSSQYFGRVFETSVIGSAVLQVTALDKDQGQNAEIHYSIESGNQGNSFSIDPFLGIIKVAGELSHDRRSQYEMEVKASDKGEPPLSVFTTVYITVTLSDNAKPKFQLSPISAVISEAAKVGSFVIVITASSQSSVFYQITGGNVNGTFGINPNSGTVVTQTALDYEAQSSYTLTVRATNMAGMASDVRLLVYVKDENDNAPVFTQADFVGFIAEVAAPGSVVLTNENTPLVIHATDADKDANARLVYEIMEPFANEHFAIDSGTGVIQTINSLDYEKRRVFHFTVQAHDSGVPSLFTRRSANVTIHITDVNDCVPRFNQDSFETTLLVPTYKGVKVITLNATDDDSVPNTKLLFSILDGNIGNKFKIDPVLGEIYVQNATHLRLRYILTVRVSDGRFTGTATVEIHVRENKDHGLKFTQEIFTVSIQENTFERKTLAVISTIGNKMNEPLFYSILNPDMRFDIGPTSGVLFSTGIPFDREDQDTFDVIVAVTKEQKGAAAAHVLVKVTVEDVNDNAPVFVNMPYSSVAQVDAVVGAVFRQVAAIDRDTDKNSDIKYYLSEQDKYFQINPSGEISLKRPFKPESLNERFVLIVVAEDGGERALSSTAEVIITVVSKATPMFQRPFYKIEIPEDVQLHTPVVQVLANASVGPHTVYKISEGDPFGHFSVDFNTGVIEVIQPLDYEAHPAHRLSIQAMDSLTGTYSEVFVDIILEDVNDNAPIFATKRYNISLPESTVIDTSVLQVTASDLDAGNNKEIFYQLYTTNGTISDHFRIDSQSGVIWTAALLDHEMQTRHELTVKAVDGGAYQLHSEVTVVIHVTDLNDNPPVFTQQLYYATISDLSSPGHFVICVQASDADSTYGGRLEYSFLSLNEDSIFGIDKRSGEIIISNNQIQKLRPAYNLIVSATDGVFRALAEVKVSVMSTNQHSPSFAQDKYVVELPENSTVGTLVTQVQVHDKDTGIYGQVTLFIVNDVVREKFTLNADGYIFTVDSFDRENLGEEVIHIDILAVDGGGRVSFCTVTVIILDVNDNTPQFMFSEYKAVVQQNVQKGTTVMRIKAVDKDEGSNADIVYAIDSDVGHFEIHPLSGVVATKSSLMDLQNGLYSFFVKAEDSGSSPKQSVIPVSIKILPPELAVSKFAESLLQLQLAEDLPVGTKINVIHPSETARPVIYSLVRGNTPESNKDDVFVIDSNTGKLKLTKRLDFEATKWYQLLIQVLGTEDGIELISIINVYIEVKDINDNSPQFDSLPFQSFIAENLPGGTSVVQVRATDLDSGLNSQVTYSLDETQETPDILQLFAVDSETGWVTTIGEIDREKRERYRITVIATDRSPELQMTGTTVVEVTVIDLNDNSPSFSEAVYKAAVREDESAPGTVVKVLTSIDFDSEEVNRKLTCFITGGDPHGTFKLEYVNSACAVVTAKTLDREDREFYLLNLTATDGTYVAKTAVELTVLDANDNSPVFEKDLYTGTVQENAPAGKPILQVLASDQDIQSNAEVAYQLTGSEAESFSIDCATGTLKTLLPLDREKREVYKLKVQAVDGGNRSCQADVIITVEDINDSAPIFTSDLYHISIFRNTQPGAHLAQLQASDADAGLNGKIHYTFEDSAEGLFAIEEESGIISLVNSLNRDMQATYRLKVRAADHGSSQRLSSFCSVEVAILDANDHPPVFEHRDYITTVAEDVTLGTRLLSVFAASSDAQTSAQIRYSITSGNKNGAFSIDSHTGDVFIIAQLDYETAREHYLTVQATVGGNKALSDIATIRVHVSDVNDNSPVFNQEVYTTVVSEDSEPGHPVLTVIANDFDGPSNSRIRLSIVDGNQGSPFIIDAVSGVVKVAHQLDREKIPQYKLTIQASDSGNPPKSSSVAVVVTVADVNDNPPVFSKANYSLVIQENLPSGSSVLQLSVTDSDAPENGPPFSYSIVKGNEGKPFRIDQKGAVRTTPSLKSVGKERYVLHIQVSDSGKPPLHSSSLLHIHVTEGSMYPPSVLPHQVIILVPGEEFPGGMLGKVHATDPDKYDTLTYSLQPPVHNLFSVSGSDGHLLARRGLDVGHYPLNVSVSDGHFTSSARVTVHVLKVTRQMLDTSVSVHFADVSAESFLQKHWRKFQRAFSSTAGAHRPEMQIISLQPTKSTGGLDVLMSLESSLLENFLQKLNTSLEALREMSDLKVVKVSSHQCSDVECPSHMCRQVFTLDQNSIAVYSTTRVSYVTPRHHVTATCLCKDGKCSKQRQGCANNPCPEGHHCESLQGEDKYRCICSRGEQEKCAGESLMTFSENSYIKYRLKKSTRGEIKFSLRLKTLSSHGTVMFVKGRGFIILEVVSGRLQCRLDCGSGTSTTVSMLSVEVSDGQWHSVELEVKGNFARLVLDGLHSASGISQGTLLCLGLDKQVILGGRADLFAPRPRRSLPPSTGLHGCMDAVLFNGQSLFLHSESLPGSVVEDMARVTPGCGIMQETLGMNCLSNPCLNGGSCSQKPDGGYYCRCHPLFMGSHCEFSISPCASNPCLYGGTCIQKNNDYYCRCRGRYTGQRCEMGPYCRENPCLNAGHCIDSLDGPVCECAPGFKGERCETDVDECVQLPCLNGGWCVNTYGSFNCSCTLGFGGKLCEREDDVHNVFISNSWHIGLTELAGMLIFMIAIFIFALVFVLISTGSCKPAKDEEKEKYRALDAYIQRTYLDSKPSREGFVDIPIKPVSYTPSPHGIPHKAGDVDSVLKLNSFTPDVVFGLKKAVAVCSVAPNLPHSPGSCSPTDCDTVQKLDWNKEDDENVDTNSYITTEEEGTASKGGVFQFTDDNTYHWDTSDWMTPGLQGLIHCEFVQTPSVYPDITAVYPTPHTTHMDHQTRGNDTENGSIQPPKPSFYDEQLHHLECRDERAQPHAHTVIPPATGHLLGSLQDNCLDHSQPYQTVQGVHQGLVLGPSEVKASSIYSGSTLEEGQGILPSSLHTSTLSLSDLSASGEELLPVVSDCESLDEAVSGDITTPMLDKDPVHTEG